MEVWVSKRRTFPNIHAQEASGINSVLLELKYLSAGVVLDCLGKKSVPERLPRFCPNPDFSILISDIYNLVNGFSLRLAHPPIPQHKSQLLQFLLPSIVLIQRIQIKDFVCDFPHLHLLRALRDAVPSVVPVDVLEGLVARVAYAAVDLDS
jgi:hypothetical protein